MELDYLSVTIGEYGHRVPEVLAMLFLLLLVLIPLIAVTEVSRAMGPGALRDLLRSPVRGRGDEGSGSRDESAR